MVEIPVPDFFAVEFCLRLVYGFRGQQECNINRNIYMNNHSRFKKSSWIVLLPLALILGSARLLAADWPQWRGPQRDGISREKGLLKDWPKEGPRMLWQVKAIGSGYSTPAVVGDRLYLLANDGLENEFVQALAAKDGTRIWSTRLGKVGEPDQKPNYAAARSTPTIDGDL